MLCDHPDFDLCNEMFKVIVNKYSDAIIATELPDHERVVVLVWSVAGIIENGGFQYLFGSSLPGDPVYKHTLEAFEKIRCDNAIQLFKQALSIFPDSKPPENDRIRIKKYEEYPENKSFALDVSFSRELKNITGCLANYIRINMLSVT